MPLASALVFVASMSIGGPDLPPVEFEFQSTRKDAIPFAAHVVAASRMISVGHIHQASPKQLVASAIEGLYDNRKRAVPAAIRKRLDDLPKADDDEVRLLLRQVYEDTCVSRKNGVEETLAVAIDAMNHRLEPGARPDEVRNRYIRAADVRSFSSGEGRPAGVGLIFEADKKSGMLRVITPVRGGPAHKAGIGAGDIITHFRILTDEDGQLLPAPKLVSTKGMTYEQANAIILGRPGSQITLVIERPKNAK
jgi:C-terminal processing protease CtpA/Prc